MPLAPDALPARATDWRRWGYRQWPIRRKLLVAFLGVFAGTFALNWGASRWLLDRVVHRQVEKELENTTTALENLVKTSIDASITSYLRGIAEKNAELVASFHARVRSGELGEAEARKRAAATLLAQRIGDSGYIYILDGTGRIRIHPKPELVGADLTGHAFIREQLHRRTGYLEYQWANPGETRTRPKALYMTYFAPWDWILSVSSYRDEFRHLVNTADFRTRILDLRFGETGYPYLIDTQGTLLVHPYFEGKNILDSRDSANRPFIREIVALKSGRIIYPWRNPGETSPREKLVVFRHIPEMNWIVASSSYLEEFYRAGAQFAWVTGGALLLSAALAGIATFAISRALTRPLVRLAERVSQAGENTFDPLPVEGSDEVGVLAGAFNAFLARIETSQRNLEASEGRHRRLFEHAVEGIFQSTPEGRFLVVNPSMAHILGYASPEEVLAEVQDIGARLYVNPRARGELWRRLDAAGVVRGFQAELHRADGSTVWVMINARAIRQGERLVCMEGFLTDITEEKQSREALLEQRRELEARVENRTLELRRGIARLEQHNAEMADLHEFTEMLQLCQGLPESLPVIRAFLPRLLPDAQADLFLADPATGLFLPIPPAETGEFPPEACWALREGKPYLCPAAGGRPRCDHLASRAEGDTLCLPVAAGGEMHGLLQVLPTWAMENGLEGHGRNVAERLATALTTLKLRVRLREQSIHDPLTGLHNRRYFDEVAHRELQRAARRGHTVGFALFDIDHFKRFNDTHGHDAGDAVLRQLTRFVASRLRAEDLAFRLGGEEFLLLLPDADGAATRAKLEILRQDVETELRVEHEQARLAVTISVGVAAFPEDGTLLEDLVKAADTAMYCAKAAGRNCVR